MLLRFFGPVVPQFRSQRLSAQAHPNLAVVVSLLRQFRTQIWQHNRHFSYHNDKSVGVSSDWFRFYSNVAPQLGSVAVISCTTSRVDCSSETVLVLHDLDSLLKQCCTQIR